MTTTILADRLAQLRDGSVTLDVGDHLDFSEGHCVNEVASWISGEAMTDEPACMNRMLIDIMRDINDAWGGRVPTEAHRADPQAD